MEEALDLFNYFFDLLMQNISKNEALRMIMFEIRDLTYKAVKDYYNQNYTNKSNLKQDARGKIEVCRSNFIKIINILKTSDESRSEFVKGFNKWKKHREESVDRLDKIAKAMHKERKIVNALRIIFSVVGIGAGACILTSIFFPPAGMAVLPAWLGRSAIAAYLPFFLRRTIPATSMLAIRGGIASAVSGVSELSTAIAEIVLLKKHIDEAKDVIETDKEHFNFMAKWFTHTQNFIEASENLLDTSVLNIVLKDIQKLAAEIRKSQNKTANMQMIFEQISCKMNINPVLPHELTLVVIAVFLMIFLIQNKSQILLSCLVATTDIILTGAAINAGLNSVKAFTALSTKGAMAGVKRAPKVLIRDASLGVFAGLGLALNTSTLILSTMELHKGSVCEHGKKIEDVCLSLKEELTMLENINEELQDSIISDLFWNSYENAKASSMYLT